MLEAETQDILGGRAASRDRHSHSSSCRSGPRGSRAPGPRRKARAGGTRAPRGRRARCPPRPAPPRSREDPARCAAERPAGPAPTTSTLVSDASAGMRSGCQPLRHSSMKEEFCVQRLSDMVMSPVTQMLQPMHSRMSSMRPSSIFCGRNGSAIDGRAAPMKSRMPCFTCRTIMSGEVKRPTPTTGFGVSCLMPRIRSSCAPSGLKREVPEQASQVPWAKSQRSGSSACMATRSRSSALVKPERARHLVERQAHRDGAGVAHLVARVRDQLLQQPRAVLERAAIFVRALIGARREEMLDHAEAMRAIEAEDVVARPLRAAVGQLVPVAQVADVLLVHGAGLHRIAGEGEDRQVRSAPAALRACRDWARWRRYRPARFRPARRWNEWHRPSWRGRACRPRPRCAVR